MDWPKAAADMLENLDEFGREACPPKPRGIPADAELGRLCARMRDGKNLGENEKVGVLMFSEWRAAVLRVEDINASRMTAILSLIMHVEPEGEITEAGKSVRQFFKDQGWGWPPRLVDDDVVRRLPPFRAMEPSLPQELRQV